MMTASEEKAYNWAFGLHSKIPSCCIDFFVEEWDKKQLYLNDSNPYQQAVDAAHFGYVPCPKCLGRNNRVKIKTCAIECGGDHREDFVPLKEATDGYRSDTHKQLHPSDRI